MGDSSSFFICATAIESLVTGSVVIGNDLNWLRLDSSSLIPFTNNTLHLHISLIYKPCRTMAWATTWFWVNLLNFVFFVCFFFVLPILVNVPVNASHATEMDDQACGKTQRRISKYDHKINILPSACGGRDGKSA